MAPQGRLSPHGFEPPLRDRECPAVSPPASPSTEFQACVLGRYRLIRVLGSGSTSVVYEARDVHTEQRLALKRLTAPGAGALARFKEEFRVLQGLHDPGLVGLRSLFESDDELFISMELVEGVDLLQWATATAPTGFAPTTTPAGEGRVRSTFQQIVCALQRLHEAGILHRDLKPSNIRVTPQGRAVLLDFGLAAQLKSEVGTSGVVGSAAYMAPEQATGAAVNASADWYALGVCLYEVLTGKQPFTGDGAAAILRRKQGALATAPSRIVQGIPADLERLALGLMAPFPDERLGAEQALSLLGGTPAPVSLRPHSTSFEGREAELQLLDEAYERARHEPAVAVVEGPSGVGKSALLEEYLRRLRRREPGAVILRARCYESEQTAYKALDGCMNELGRHLVSIAPEGRQGLLPDRTAPLAELFPGLARVPGLADTGGAESAADPTVRRMEAFESLAILLQRVSNAGPVVLAIDDLQWADTESHRILSALLGSAQLRGVLLLCTSRLDGELSDEEVQALTWLRNFPGADLLRLRGLPEASARALVCRQLGEAANDGWHDIIARESRGHPLLLLELVRYAQTHPSSERPQLTLHAALTARVEALEPGPRALLETIAVAGRPYEEHVFARATELDHEALHLCLTELLSERLVRRHGTYGVGCIHDQVRDVSTRLCSSDRLRALHRRLADALEDQPDSDPAEVARHFDEAGEGTLAVASYARAAEVAFASLAFSRSAALYARAVELCPRSETKARTRWTIQRGHALARAGQSAEAARLFTEAAAAVTGPEQVQLQLRASQQLIQSAQLQEGLATARTLLDQLGVPLGGSRLTQVAQLGLYRARFVWRGMQSPRKPALDSTSGMRLEALWQLGFPVGWADTLPGAVLTARHLEQAMRSGDAAHTSRALAQEGMFRAMQQPNRPENHEPLFQRSREIADRLGEPAVSAYQAFCEGSSALFRFELNRARGLFDRSTHILETQCPGEPWLLTNARAALGSVLLNLGEHAGLATRMDAWIAEAHERRDRFTLAALPGLGFGFVRHIRNDDPGRAREEMDEVMAPWPAAPFSLAHFGQMFGVVGSELYRGGRTAYDWLEARRAVLDRAFVLRTRLGQEWLAFYRFHAMLGARPHVSSRERDVITQQARKQVRVLRAIGTPNAMAFATHFAAQLAVLGGDQDSALSQARQARRRLRELNNYIEHAAAYLEGLLIGGDQGAAECRAAVDWFAGRGWKAPRRALATALPAIDETEAALP